MAKADRVSTVDCADAETFTQSYVDGELAGRDRDMYERHLSGCERCRGAARFAARMKAAVRGHLPRRQVPSALEQRLRGALGAQPEAPPRWPWLTWPRVVPALAAVGVMVAIVGTVRTRNSIVMEQARRTYQAELPLDVAGPDCSSVTSWFRGRVDFPVHPPRLPAQITCQGGRLVNVEDHPAAYLVYQDPKGHRVSVLVFDPESSPIEGPYHRLVNGREVFYRRGPGISTAAFHDQGLGYVMTADVDEDSLTGLLQASFTQPVPTNELH
ncbi:MAG TPA: zf-HC2 domain-containing protein [Polyangia bacterium]|jgi:anti-sigma factor RsiW